MSRPGQATDGSGGREPRWAVAAVAAPLEALAVGDDG